MSHVHNVMVCCNTKMNLGEAWRCGINDADLNMTFNAWHNALCAKMKSHGCNVMTYCCTKKRVWAKHGVIATIRGMHE